MKRITRWYSVRHYWVKGDEDDFNSFPKLNDALAVELLAYYRGEPVTDWMIDQARSEVCKTGSEKPLPIVSLGRMRLLCTDGVYDKYDLGTLLRHFELVSDLYELDPTVREMNVPFSTKTADRILIRRDWDVSDELDMIKFLRPKNVDNYLYINWHGREMTKDLALLIGSGMSKESRMANSELAQYIPDWDLYPVASWAYRMRDLDVLRSVISSDYPSVYLKCLLDLGGSDREIAELIATSEFQDVLPVEGEQSKWRRYLDSDRLVRILSCIHCPKKFRYALAVLGLRHPRLENDKVEIYTPFYVEPTWMIADDVKMSLVILRNIDQSFTEAMMYDILCSCIT